MLTSMVSAIVVVMPGTLVFMAFPPNSTFPLQFSDIAVGPCFE
jgi:hypothetical protein